MFARVHNRNYSTFNHIFDSNEVAIHTPIVFLLQLQGLPVNLAVFQSMAETTS